MEVASSAGNGHLLRKLKSIAPEAFHDGKLDIEQLKLLSGVELLYKGEHFGLTWPGKAES